MGDVFTIPLDAARLGVGQIAATRLAHTYLLAIYSRSIRNETELVNALSSPIAFLAESLDAKIWVGDWTVVANRPVDPDIPFPAYRETVGSIDRVDIVDYSGARRRPSRGTEPLWVPNRKVVAPIRLERALKALVGLEPWDQIYDELRPSHATSTAALFQD